MSQPKQNLQPTEDQPEAYEKQFVLWGTIESMFEKIVKMIESAREGKDLAFGQSSMLNPEMFFNYFHGLRLAKKEHRPVVMTNFCFTPEILYAMDMFPMCQEIGSVALAVGGFGIKYIDLAEEQGLDSAQCNAQKVWIGASMLGEAPYPDLMIYGSQPCDSTNSQYQLFQEIYSYAPVYTIDVPYWHYDPKNVYFDPKTVPYVAQQIKNIIPWLEKETNQKLDHDRFIATIKNSNETREVMLEAMELMKAVPAPLPSLTAFSNYAIIMTSLGLPEATKYAASRRDMAKERVQKKQGALEIQGREEKFRVMWLYLPIMFDTFIFDWMEKKFGAVCVMDMMGYTMTQLIDTKDEDTIFEGLAAQLLDAPMGRQSRGPADYYIDDMIRIGKEYKVDCAIYGGHLGCKHSHAMATLMREVIEEELAIPCLTFEVDIIDPRQVNSREIKRKLKMFFQNIA